MLRLLVVAPYLPHNGPSSWLLTLVRGFHLIGIKIMVYVTGGIESPGSMTPQFFSFCHIVVGGSLRSVTEIFNPDTILFWEFDVPAYFKDQKVRKVLVHHGLGSYIPPNCDAIICLHEYIKDRLSEYSDITVVAYPAVPERQMDENLKDKFNLTSPVAGYVGRLVPEKNITSFIKAILRTNWSLLVAGEGPEFESISSLVKDSPKIKMLGTINNPWNVYKSVDLMCLPSRFEGFSFVTIEAALSRTPMMLTKVGASACLFDETSVFWTDGSEDGMVQILEHIAKNLDAAKNKAGYAYNIISGRCSLDTFVKTCAKVCFPQSDF